MEQPEDQRKGKAGDGRKQSILRKLLFGGILLFVIIASSFIAAIAYNNISLWSDGAFAGWIRP